MTWDGGTDGGTVGPQGAVLGWIRLQQTEDGPRGIVCGFAETKVRTACVFLPRCSLEQEPRSCVGTLATSPTFLCVLVHLGPSGTSRLQSVASERTVQGPRASVHTDRAALLGGSFCSRVVGGRGKLRAVRARVPRARTGCSAPLSTGHLRFLPDRSMGPVFVFVSLECPAGTVSPEILAGRVVRGGQRRAPSGPPGGTGNNLGAE